MKKDRLDRIMVDRGLAPSRERARALIMEGKVAVDGAIASKAGDMASYDADIEIKGEDLKYVSRGGLKLEAAIRRFSVNMSGKIAMDVGSSTGGFTDLMLQEGVSRVYCVDVGYGQLAWKLRLDPRVVLIERTNIRYLDRERIPDVIDLATIDVSFISLEKVVPKVIEFLSEKGEIIALIKPQFEVGKGEVGKGGVVRDEEKRLRVIERIKAEFSNMGLCVVGVIESPIKGQKGNIEYLLYARRA